MQKTSKLAYVLLILLLIPHAASAQKLTLSGIYGVRAGGTGLSSTVANQILYSSATNVIAGLATANNGVLITSGAGVPSISSTIPSATQDNITRLGTLATNLVLTAGNDIRPSADSTTAINIANAAGTDFVSFDTTNLRVNMSSATPTLRLTDNDHAGANGNLQTIIESYGSDGVRVWTMGDLSTSFTDFWLQAEAGNGIRLATGGGNTRVYISSTGNVGIDTVSPTNLVSLGGNAARIFWMERHTTGNTAGNSLTIRAGGATSGATDKNAGDLLLTPGTATGTGKAKVQIQSVLAGATGTVDRVPATHFQVADGHIESLGTAPAVSACGTTPTLSTPSTDMAGKVTVGTTPGTSCTLTFATAHTNAPPCQVTNETTANLIRATSTTTTVVFAGTLLGGDVLAYSCLGRA